MTRILALVLAALLLLATTASAQVAPQDPLAAKKHFDVGLKLYGEKAFVEALAEFDLSYKLGGRPSALKNVAQCHRDLKHFADAYEAYEKMLAVHGAQLGAEKPMVERALSELGILTGTVAVTSSQPGAVVEIDGKTVGTTPLDKPKRVNLGAHTVKVTKAGFEPFEKELNIGSEQAAQVDAKLDAEVVTGHVSVREQNGRDVHLVVDGQDDGPLPWSGDLPPGDHTFEAKGTKYASEKQILRIGRKERLDVVLNATPTTGHLRISVSPPSAKIRVDGADHGTGVWESDVTPGIHRIVVSLEGSPEVVREVTVEKGELAVAEIPIVSAMGLVAHDPVYKGFYGRWSTPVGFGFGTGYVPPAGTPGTLEKGAYFSTSVKLQFGHSFGWFGLEAVTSFMFTVRDNDQFVDPSGTPQIRTGYPMGSIFLGPGVRATSKHPVLRVTAGAALGAAVHQLMNGPENMFRYSPCDNGANNPICQGPSGSNNSSSPGYTGFAMTGDLGLLIGNGSPGPKFWIGVDWYVDFAPDIAIGVSEPRIPAQYSTHGGATILHGPQFFIGPSLGVGFGH